MYHDQSARTVINSLCVYYDYSTCMYYDHSTFIYYEHMHVLCS